MNTTIWGWQRINFQQSNLIAAIFSFKILYPMFTSTPFVRRHPFSRSYRTNFAKFLKESCLVPLGILYLPTSVGLGSQTLWLNTPHPSICSGMSWISKNGSRPKWCKISKKVNSTVGSIHAENSGAHVMQVKSWGTRAVSFMSQSCIYFPCSIFQCKWKYILGQQHSHLICPSLLKWFSSYILQFAL